MPKKEKKQRDDRRLDVDTILFHDQREDGGASLTFKDILLNKLTWVPTLTAILIFGFWYWIVIVSVIRHDILRTIAGWSPFIALVILAAYYNPESRWS